MILTGPEIERQVNLGRISITPFKKSHVTTNSYDLCLGSKYLKYNENMIDVKVMSRYNIFEIPSEGLRLGKRDFVLAETEEKIGSNYFVPLIHAKSGIARVGLFVHITADLIDIGSFGKSTLQLFATMPITIYPGMKIAQVTFWQPVGEIKLYDGKYQHSDGPRPSMIYMDFKK
ncbi:MAG: dCTP deaminase [Bdellovibrionales bacterium]|nr:dCTP deaminase [Bdellovibrionales bacterium]